MNPYCLITHIADPDGAFPIILMKLVLPNADFYSCDIKEVDGILKETLQNDYEKIYIVDLNISEEMAKIVNEVASTKVEVYDHHESNLGLNCYPFEHVVVKNGDRKECGTTLFYEYLKQKTNHPILEKEVLKQMIELIRENDTFDFTEEHKQAAIHFRTLYDVYGREDYIEHFYHYILENDTFAFVGTEKAIIDVLEKQTERYVEEKLEHIRFATIDGIRVGIVFAEQNRSYLGNRMAEMYADKIDIAIIINVDRSVSYRAIKPDININVIAQKYNGGGHQHAGGSPLPIELQNKITQIIFSESEIL